MTTSQRSLKLLTIKQDIIPGNIVSIDLLDLHLKGPCHVNVG